MRSLTLTKFARDDFTFVEPDVEKMDMSLLKT